MPFTKKRGRSRTPKRGRGKRGRSRSIKRRSKVRRVNKKALPKAAAKAGAIVRFVEDQIVGEKNAVGLSSRVAGIDLLPKRWMRAAGYRKRRLFSQHTYTDCNVIQVPVGAAFHISGLQMRVNDIFDPQFAIGGHQPEGVDYLKTQYKRYKVHGSRIKYTVMANEIDISNFGNLFIALRCNKHEDTLIQFKPQKFVAGYTGLPNTITLERLKEIYAEWPNKKSIYRKGKTLYNAKNANHRNKVTLEDSVWVKDLFIKQVGDSGASVDTNIPFSVASTTAVAPLSDVIALWGLDVFKSECDATDMPIDLTVRFEMTYYVEWYDDDALFVDVNTED